MTGILIAGGARDPNILAVLNAAEARGVEIYRLLVGKGHNPSITWKPDFDHLWIDGKQLKATGAFVRRNVFHDGGMDEIYRAATWFTVLQGWLAVTNATRTLNRNLISRYINKLHSLVLAKSVGLKIPDTVITNFPGPLLETEQPENLIAKPVTGGGYCKVLDELLDETEFYDAVTANPAIVQQRLMGPDARIYWINGRCIGFQIHSDAVDYRESQNKVIERMDHIPDYTVISLGRLMDSLGLNWGAADFKICPNSGELTFLEINSDPMFSAFDRIGGNVIANTIVNFLTGSVDEDYRL